MTARVIRLTVDLATGETISRDEAGEREIAERDYLEGMAAVMCGSKFETIAERVGEKYYNIKGDQNTWTLTSRSSEWTRPSV